VYSLLNNLKPEVYPNNIKSTVHGNFRDNVWGNVASCKALLAAQVEV
jgi:hypothetical protein